MLPNHSMRRTGAPPLTRPFVTTLRSVTARAEHGPRRTLGVRQRLKRYENCSAQTEVGEMLLQIVKLRTELSEDELLKIAHERAPQFRALPGLVQKY